MSDCIAQANVKGPPCGDALSPRWLAGRPYVGEHTSTSLSGLNKPSCWRWIRRSTQKHRFSNVERSTRRKYFSVELPTADHQRGNIRPDQRQPTTTSPDTGCYEGRGRKFHGGGNITFFVRPEYRSSAVVISDEPKAKPCWNPPHMQHRWPCYKIEKKLARRWWFLCCNVVHNHYLPLPPLDLINILLVKTSEWNNGEMEDGIDLRT